MLSINRMDVSLERLFDTVLGSLPFLFLHLHKATVIFRTKSEKNNISDQSRFGLCIVNHLIVNQDGNLVILDNLSSHFLIKLDLIHQ